MYREQVICRGCGTEFEAHTPTRDYCSSMCKILRTAAAGTLATCYICHSVYWDEPPAAGRVRADFEKEHELCRRTVLDREGRDEACRCRDCKKRQGITDVLSVPPSKRKRGASGHGKHRQFVLDRDDYICQICGIPTDPEARQSDDRYPTLDHIDSIGLYGLNDEPDNLRTAHRWCNIALSDGSFVDEKEVRSAAQNRFK